MPIVLLVVRRTLLSIVTLLLVSLIIFSMLEVLPGDVATRILGRDATPESLEVLRTELGLDRPARSATSTGSGAWPPEISANRWSPAGRSRRSWRRASSTRFCCRSMPSRFIFRSPSYRRCCRH